MLLAARAEGAPGTICGAANFAASQMIAAYDAVRAGDLATARAR